MDYMTDKKHVLLLSVRLSTMCMHHYDLPCTSKCAFSLTHKHTGFIRTKDVGRATHTHTQQIHTHTHIQSHPWDQSRDRILLQGSLTRRYAEIEGSALYIRNEYRRKMQAKVEEVKFTYYLCAAIVYLSWLRKCRVLFNSVDISCMHVCKRKKAIKIARVSSVFAVW